MTVTQGDLIMVDVVCAFAATGSANTPTDSLGNTYSHLVHLATGNNIEDVWSAFSNTGGSNIVTVSQSTCSPFLFSVDDYSFVVNIGNTNQVSGASSAASGSNGLTITINANSAIYETFGAVFNACPTVSGSSGQTTRELNCFSGQNVEQLVQDRLYSTGGSTVSTSAWSGATGNGGFNHIVIELKGSGGAPSGTNVQSACFGNCGSPAVTLANTNSTHTINFNQSITLFYEFQSSLAGTVLNETTSLSKSYVGTFQTVTLGVYVVLSCPPAVLPFSTACPGVLEAQQSFIGPGKGQVSMSQQVGISAGQWIGLAVTGSFNKLDLNDTNTNVPLFYSNGQMSATISNSASASTFCGGCKMGLWAFIAGGVIVTGPPPGLTGCANNWAQLDCLLPALSNGMCFNLTPACQTSGSLFWIIILTILSFLLVTVGFASAHVTKFVAAGDVFIFFFLTWFFMFAGVGLLQTFVVIFFLFGGAVIFSRTARNYF